jgi:hypothetical protein
MAETRDSGQENQPRGIAAAAIEGAREGEQSQAANPDDAPAKLARPAPGMTEQPEASPSTTNQYTGVTGAIRDDDDPEWRRAGGGSAEGGTTNPDAADEPRER